jgi:hypothetical protein
MMTLPRDFHFSQHNLQDYVDCPRRFELRHLLRLEWPAVQSAPVIEQELRMERGTQFHRMVQQWLHGIPANLIEQRASDPLLRQWWQSFLQHNPLETVNGERRAEFTLSAPFAGYRLIAKLDVLVAQPGSAARIFDWKTSEHRPKPAYLQSRVQSRLYPLITVLAGAALNEGQPWQPAQLNLTYWFVQHPTDPEVIPYNAQRFQRDHAFIEGLIMEIERAAETGDFPLTEDKKRCQFCQYRSLCERGIAAGWLDDVEDIDELGAEETLFEIDLEQIGEIAF